MTSAGTVIFDFDSTLIQQESLELILAKSTHNNPEKMDAIAELTEQGMNCQIDFASSLSQRLAIAKPCKQDVVAFAKSAPYLISLGMQELIEQLNTHHVDLWVLSGGLSEAIQPICIQLGFRATQIYGVDLLWDQKGQCVGPDPKCLMADSKLKASQTLKTKWHSPSIMIGDGMTDYELYQEECVNEFIGFTANVKRQTLIETGARQAESINSLKAQLEQILNISLG